MKSISKILAMVMIIGLAMSSCSKNETPEDTNCDYEILLEPICSFNPKVAQTVPFPVNVQRDGSFLTHPEYEFSWSTNQDFGGSAISVTYQDLPLTVTITDTSNGCTGEATLENTFWD